MEIPASTERGASLTATNGARSQGKSAVTPPSHSTANYSCPLVTVVKKSQALLLLKELTDS